MRWLLGWGLVAGTSGVALGYGAGCGPYETFACGADVDCVLSGEPGLCDPDGRCVYADGACASGWSYPAATPNVGGACVPAGPEEGQSTGPELSSDETDGEVDEDGAGSTGL
ncbi:MAG: hypothetical protein AAF721_27100, partial [Myxococcota bacterium]